MSGSWSNVPFSLIANRAGHCPWHSQRVIRRYTSVAAGVKTKEDKTSEDEEDR